MRTEDLIDVLKADAGRRALPLSTAWWGALGLAILLAGAVFFAGIGPRPDFAAAAETLRFLFKFLVSATLAVTAFAVVRVLSRPSGRRRIALPWLVTAPALVAAAIAVELAVVPASEWGARWIGSNGLVCLTFILLIGLGPLAVFLAVLKHGAPTRPALAGSVAGLLAGGIAATFYAAHCTDDSPLFVATWYTMAIAGLACLGALGAHRFARW